MGQGDAAGNAAGHAGEQAWHERRYRFFERWDWSWLIEANRYLCRKGGWQHGVRDEKSAKVQDLWRKSQQSDLTFLDALVVLRECHLEAPFLFCNGQVFVGFAEKMVGMLLQDVARVRRVAAIDLAAGFVAGEWNEVQIREMFDRYLCGGDLKAGDRVMTLRPDGQHGVILEVLDDGTVEWQADGSTVVLRTDPRSLLRE